MIISTVCNRLWNSRVPPATIRLLFTLVLLAVVPVHAIVVDISAATDTIHPEAPLRMKLSIALEPDEVDAIRAVYVDHESIHVRITDLAGHVVAESEFLPWACMRNWHVWLAQLRHADLAEEWLVLGQWCSTLLPPGQYRIGCELSKISVVNTGEFVAKVKEYSQPLRWEFPLQVLERDNGAVRMQYEELMLRARAVEAMPEEPPKRGHAVELIVYARVPIALPYQLELLRGKVKMYNDLFNECEAVELALYLIDTGRPEAADGLVDVFVDLQAGETEMDPVSREILSRIVLWSIHEMHARGNPDVQALTTGIVERYPKPDDPRPVPGLD